MYGSPITRWLLATVGIVAGLVLILGDGHKWRSTPSLHWLGSGPVPLQAWGCLLVIYGVMLLFEPTRPIGYAVGCFLFALFTVSLIVTLDVGSDAPKNVIGVAAMLDVTVFHAFSIRTAWVNRLLG